MKVCETTNYTSNQEAQTSSRLERWLLKRLRQQLAHIEGSLILTLPSGYCERFGQGEPVADVRIKSLKAFVRLFFGGVNGWSEAYIAGEWESSNIADLVQWGITNEPHLAGSAKASFVTETLHNFYHARRDNTKKGSKRNISAHYDLGNDFYAQWLDQTMTYSAALYKSEQDSLQQAQIQKYQRILELVNPKAGDTILEVGCGWGGFANQAATDKAANVQGITLSEEQLAWAQEHVKPEQGSASFSLTDYRDVEGTFDHIVSIEMFEAVGVAHWDTYFDTLKQRLKPGGRAVLQIITIDDDRFDDYARQADFIQRYIFPGGMLPSVERLTSTVEKHGFRLEERQMFGKDYARTLRAWAKDFEAQWPNIEPLGYDARFQRLWRYYLAYCEGGFDYGSIDVGFFVLSHDADSTHSASSQ